MRRGGRLALVGALALAATSCQATVGLGIDARADGTGTVVLTVTLDHDAASRLADLGGAKVDGLERQGWRVDGPLPAPGGGAVYRASQSYRTPDQAGRLVAGLSGSTGPFRDFRITRSRSLFETTTRFEGTVDLQKGVDSLGDPTALAADGSALGVDVAGLRSRLSSDLDRVIRLQVSARLPGSLTGSNSPSPASNGAVWQPKFGEAAVLSASSRQFAVWHIVLAVIVALLLLAGASLGVVALLRRRR